MQWGENQITALAVHPVHDFESLRILSYVIVLVSIEQIMQTEKAPDRIALWRWGLHIVC